MRHVKCSLLALAVFTLTACGGTSSEADTPVTSEGNGSQADPLASLNLPTTAFNYSDINLPLHYLQNTFPADDSRQYAAVELDNTPSFNPVTDAGATLGRVLFYDKKLSANGTVSCASCHQQQHGFSDPQRFSAGFAGELSFRHSPGLANARYYRSGKFFWDERAETLEQQAIMPFLNPAEMGLVLPELEEIVRQQDYYKVLFTNAYGDEDVSEARISNALAQFVRSLVSTTAKYDLARAEVNSAGVPFPMFTEQENLGKTLFFTPRVFADGSRASCSGCHISEAFVGSANSITGSDSTAVNNGLDTSINPDPGIFDSSRNPNDMGKFKVPSLKNIAVRAPYMHDGRFATLEQVVEHYSTGIRDQPNLATVLRDNSGNPVQFNFSAAETAALVAFLRTLTDEPMLNDEKFSDPFK